MRGKSNMKRNNRKKHVWWSCLLALALIVTMLPVMPAEEAKAAATETVSINVTYEGTKTQTLYQLMNAGRQTVSSSALTYDYTLESLASQRVAEIALDYTKSNSDVTSGKLAGEAVYCMTSDPAIVYAAWRQDTTIDAYMHTNSNCNAVGISHGVYNGHDYWVALFASSASLVPNANSYTTLTKQVSLDAAGITNRQISNAPTTISMNVGENYDLSKCSASIQVNGHYPAGEACPLNGDVNVTATDASVVSWNGKSLNALKAGTTTVTISCGGQTATAAVTVTQPTIANATISAIPDQNYTGYEITPSVTVTLGGSTLVLNRDYTLSYTNNTNVGTAVVTVNGLGNYAGSSKTASFRIVTPTVANATVTTIADQIYTGYAICPALTVYVNSTVLRENTDYTVAYTNNINIGTATVTITGIGRYSGTKTVNFRITGPNLSNATITAIPDQLYTGYDIRPSLTVAVNNVTLIQNVDYNVSYSNNRNAGTATVTITGRGNYTGTRTTTFRILSKNISNATISSIDTQRYTGRDVCPSVTVQIGSTVLVKNVDYTLSYQDNRSPGTASVTITGMGTCTGSRTVTFKIAQPSLSSASVKVSATPTYNGEEKMPRVTVRLYGETLEEDEDYEVDYRNNVNPGKATVVIYGLGDYSGSKKASFVILPAKPGWISAKANGSAAVLSWQRDKYVSGYEVYRSRNASSGFSRLGTLAKNTSTKCQNVNLARGTYYYKIRSYIQANGRKYYSAYSKARKVVIR